MASSNIKLFDENKGNMLSDSEFNISNQRMNGLQTGVASSQLQNKAMYQASLMAYAIAQVMMQNGKNANDTDAVSAFVANLSGTMLQKVYDIATTAEAQAGVATGKWMSPALVKSAIDSLAAKAQNILSDETKALFGLGADAVPDDVFTAIKSLIDNANANADSRAKIAYGSYVGTGLATTASNPLIITFPFEPMFFRVYATNKGPTIDGDSYGRVFWEDVRSLTTEYVRYRGLCNGSMSNLENRYAKKSEDGKTFYCYGASGMNDADTTYYWAAFN